MNNFFALLITFFAAIVWLRLNDFAAHRGWIESRLSRKLIHIGTGPIFVLCWLLFDNTPPARYLAALVPFAITIQFILVGLGVVKDEAAVKAMSRTGNPREILRGPLFYGLAFVIVTIFFWHDSPHGIVALMLLCGGDGLADIIGRRFGKTKLPWSRSKSWAGSLAVFFGGWLLSILILAAYIAAGIFPPALSDYLLALAVIALGVTAVESLPIPDIDNITIVLAAILLGYLVL